MEAVPNESAPAVVVAEEDFTTRLHQVNVERAVSFLNCMERIMFSCTAKGCRGAVSAAAIYYRLGACRGVGCLRATCMAQHRASLCRGKPLVELPLDDGEKVYVRFQHSLRIWTRRYVLPRLDRPLTTLTLPRFDRPEVLLACLAEARARVSIVYITDAIYWRHEGDEDPLVMPSDMWSAGTGMTKPKHVVLLPPASGISALVIQESSEVDWRAVLQHTPNLRYLSMRGCPRNAEYFSGRSPGAPDKISRPRYQSTIPIVAFASRPTTCFSQREQSRSVPLHQARYSRRGCSPSEAHLLPAAPRDPHG